jgi:uncharacterized membrane protein YkvA (DUF1232 family)
MEKVKKLIKKIKHQVIAIYYVYTDSSTSKWLKAYLILIISYAVSPIDLIPDFIPILGYLDDLVILPILIAIAIKLIPTDLYHSCLEKAQDTAKLPKKFNIISLLIVVIWISIIVYSLYKILI